MKFRDAPERPYARFSAHKKINLSIIQDFRLCALKRKKSAKKAALAQNIRWVEENSL